MEEPYTVAQVHAWLTDIITRHGADAEQELLLINGSPVRYMHWPVNAKPELQS